MKGIEKGKEMLFNLKGRSKKIVAILLAASMMCSLNLATAFATEEVRPDFHLNVEDAINEEVDFNEEEALSDQMITMDSELESDSTVSEIIADEDIKTVSDDVVDVAAAFNDSKIMTLSDNIIGISDNEAEGERDFYVNPDKAKAVIDKKYRVKLTWKKPAGSKGKILYHIYRMSSDGKFSDKELTSTNKTSFLDTTVATSEGAFVYKIVPEGAYLDKASYVKGSASYIVAAPLLVNVGRSAYVSNNNIRIGVDFADIRVSDNMVQYELYRARKNKKDSFIRIPYDEVEGCVEGEDSKPVIKPMAGGEADILHIDDNQYEEHEYGKTYYYKVVATVNIDGKDYSSESKSMKTTIYERAPISVSAAAITGTKIFLYWEDMTGNGGYNIKQALLEDEDQYQLYYRLNGGKLKKYATLMVSDVPVLDTVGKSVKITPYDRSDVSVTIPARDYYTAYYTCTDLKANGTYEFFIAPIREKKMGSRSSGSNLVDTDINDLNSLFVDQNDDKSLTVKWNTVEGAASYNLYYKRCATVDEAKATVTKWQNLDGAPADYDKKVKVKQSKEKTVSYSHKKLESGDVFVYKAIAVRGKSGKPELCPFEIGSEKYNEDKANINTGYGLLRLATPKIKVKEENGKITFSWQKVKGAAGYVIYKSRNIQDKAHPSAEVVKQGDEIIEIIDGDPGVTEELSITADKLSPRGFNLGEGLYIQVVAYAAKSPLYTNPTLYSDTDNYSSKRSKVTAGYNRPSAPLDSKNFSEKEQYKGSLAIYNGVPSTGAMLRIKTEYSAKDLSKTVLGFKIMRSYTGKNFTTVSSNYTLNGLVGVPNIDYRDMDMLTDGKTVYYRIYSVAVPYGFDIYDEDNQVISKKYVELKYCQPSKISRDTVQVKLGETKKVNINFKPSNTTMKQMEAWYIGDKSDSTNLALNSGSYVKTNNGVIKAMASAYDKAGTEGFSDTIKIEGLKTGKAYVEARTKNGLSAVFKVEVVDSTEKKDNPGNSNIIVLDPGHGGSDGGASKGNLKESEINLKISKYTQGYLEDAGFTVYLTRTSDKYVGLSDRVVYAKNKNAVAIVSQHINSGGASGSECYYSVDGTGKGLAQKMTSNTSKAVGITNRGAKSKKNSEGNDYYAIIRYARSSDKEYGGKKITGIIMENAFIDGDYDILSSDAQLKKIAEANAKAIIEEYK